VPKNLIQRASLVAGLLVCLLLQVPQRSQGQTCRGDIDGDGQVTAADLQMTVAIVAGEAAAPTLRARADVNSDGVASAADVVLDVQLQGGGCVPVPPTASPTPSPTPTVTPGSGSPTKSPVATSTPSRTNAGTATATRTPPPTATPTQTCVVVAAQFGTRDGTLTTADCQRRVGNKLRHVDVYTITGTLGQAVTVQMTATGSPPIVPYLVVIDPDGQFGQAQGSPPIQFVVSSSQPYQIMVASAPSAAQELGSYQLTLTETPCPTPVALTIDPQSSKIATLQATDCPDPGSPSVGKYLNPAHIYTFRVDSVPGTIDITMNQTREDDFIYPAFSVLTPDGIELVTQYYDWDCTPDTSDLICSEARFLALQPGMYTIIATGGTGRYRLDISSVRLCSPKTLSDIPSAPPTPCSTKSGPGCVLGSLSSRTNCAAPLPIPGISDDEPEDPNSPADLYTLTAAAGDVISVTMVSDDDAHLYLLGPAPGNQLVVQDDDSFGGGDAQLAATVVQAGTYTIVAANNYGLYPDDYPVEYTLQVQKCPVRAALAPDSAGVTRDGTFSNTDCVGFDGVPYGTYSFTGTAGDVVSVKMISEDVDAFVRMFGPDGSVVEDDDDLLASDYSTDAQVTRILPANGTYFIEASTAGYDTTPFPSPQAFVIDARTCPAIPAVPGTLSAAFADGDCRATDGTPFNVFAFRPAAAPGAASVVPPSDGCLIALLAEGAQAPNSACSTDAMDFPMLNSSGTYGFIVAANDPDLRESYTVQLAECPLSLLTFGDVHSGSLAPSDCHAAAGAFADWFLLRASANLMWFNAGVTGAVTTSFTPANLLTDMTGPFPFAAQSFGGDPESMYRLGSDLAIVLRVAGETPADQGAYTISLDPAWLRQ
jgi:hypothetical protein